MWWKHKVLPIHVLPRACALPYSQSLLIYFVSWHVKDWSSSAFIGSPEAKCQKKWMIFLVAAFTIVAIYSWKCRAPSSISTKLVTEMISDPRTKRCWFPPTLPPKQQVMCPTTSPNNFEGPFLDRMWMQFTREVGGLRFGSKLRFKVEFDWTAKYLAFCVFRF